MKRKDEVERRIQTLIDNFERYVTAYDADPPFNKPGQLENHVVTIALRRQLGSSTAALSDDSFITSLRSTLVAWGMASRGSTLLPESDFRNALRGNGSAISSLEGIALDDSNLNASEIARQAWNVIEHLGIVQSNAKLVAGSKALHHLLPDLIVPMDRAYTRVFLGWHTPEFQYGQGRIFSHAFERFARIARDTQAASYVGSGWRTSQTKVIDNAIVAFCKVESLPIPS